MSTPFILSPSIMRSIYVCQLLLWCMVLGALSWPFGALADASSPYRSLSSAELRVLAEDPTWLKLLHYDQDGQRSTVLTDDFFLSPDGKTDPLAELKATIAVYFHPWADNRDEDPRCRFPARYYWLSHRISLPDYQPRNLACQRFEKWAIPETVQSVSVMMVSGYLGNPASTFGHALLKFNTGSSDDAGLFDLTLSYGALIPEGENTFTYVVKGLFGGYEAGFSDRYFYTKDLVYSHTEFRDIWEYHLTLTDYEQKLLLFHLWEIAGKKFQYFFLKENCAYKLAELLDVVIPEDVLTNPRVWYAPVELFYRILEIDNSRRKKSEDPLLLNVNYIPSSQRKLYYQLKLLDSETMAAFNDILGSDFRFIPDRLAKFDQQQQISILDSLLAYQQYLLVVQGDKPLSKTKENRRRILEARFELPAQPVKTASIPVLAPPTAGSPPITLGIGFGHTEGADSYTLLNWSPFKSELVGKNSLQDDELVVLDLSAGLSQQDRSLFIDSFSLIKVIHLNTIPVHIKGQNSWSWQLRLGADRLHGEKGEPLDIIGYFGAGHAWRWGNIFTGYLMVDLAGHTELSHLRIKPQLGILGKFGNTKIWGHLGKETNGHAGEFNTVWEGKIQYNLSSQYALKIDGYSQGNKATYNFALSYSWK